MNFLNKSNVSTREVVEELEKTKHKLQKSQTRLINLSAAYKALQEEKKTLEATISAISSQGSTKLIRLYNTYITRHTQVNFGICLRMPIFNISFITRWFD